jgi:hypothetical protein|nr:MAG TPA: hypothetical protein [Caudoviricetes sp.]
MLLRELPNWVAKNKDRINETAIDGWKVCNDTKWMQATHVLENVKKLSEELRHEVTAINIPFFDMSELEFSEWNAIYELGAAMRLRDDDTGQFFHALMYLDDASPALQLLKELEMWEIDKAFAHATDYIKQSKAEVYELKRIVDLV